VLAGSGRRREIDGERVRGAHARHGNCRSRIPRLLRPLRGYFARILQF